MGKPNPVLVIWVAARWRTHPAIVALDAAGHCIIEMGTRGSDYVAASAVEPDLIIHPAAHGWHEALFEEAETKDGQKTGRYPYVDIALVAARKRRRARKS